MKKAIIFIIVAALVLALTPALIFAGNGPNNKATGQIWMDSPDQQMKFNAHDCGLPENDKGQVEYWNYEYIISGEVFHYTAEVISVKVDGTEARFLFQIPDGWPISGLYVVTWVKDGGSPGTNGDEYGHAATSSLTTALTWVESGVSVTKYPITDGNLVVHYYE
jgi:hypothetical protein